MLREKTASLTAESLRWTPQALGPSAAAPGAAESGRATGKQWRSCGASACLRQVLTLCLLGLLAVTGRQTSVSNL